MTVPEARDDGERQFLQIVERHGRHVMHVGADDESGTPGFSYSTGIFRATGKPELIVFSLPRDVAQFVINDYGDRAGAGEALTPGGFYSGFLEGHLVALIGVTEPDYDRRYATWASWFYDRADFPLLQLVYPDSRSGAFPWQPGYREDWRPLQPLLGPEPATQ